MRTKEKKGQRVIFSFVIESGLIRSAHPSGLYTEARSISKEKGLMQKSVVTLNLHGV